MNKNSAVITANSNNEITSANDEIIAVSAGDLPLLNNNKNDNTNNGPKKVLKLYLEPTNWVLLASKINATTDTTNKNSKKLNKIISCPSNSTNPLVSNGFKNLVP